MNGKRARYREPMGEQAIQIRNYLMISMVYGGEGGIRTPGTVTRTPHFECGAIDHSATSPHVQDGLMKIAGAG